MTVLTFSFPKSWIISENDRILAFAPNGNVMSINQHNVQCLYYFLVRESKAEILRQFCVQLA